MVINLETFADFVVCAVTYGGVFWLITSSLITCCSSQKPTAAKGVAEPAAPLAASREVNASSPYPIKVDNSFDVESLGVSAAKPLVAAPDPPPAPAKPRMYFLDNLKVFLTVVVICHHVIDDMRGNIDTGAGFAIWDATTHAPPPKTFYLIFADAMGTLDQSYFMSLFFFISGYFTPSSLDRKGVSGFLRDRFKRIGIPAVVYTYVLGPFQVWLIMAITKNDPPVSDPTVGDLNNTYQYAPFHGQTWFLYWLVLLGFIYAFTHKEPLKMPSPQVGQIFLFAFVIGIWFVLKPYPIDAAVSAMVPGGIHSLFCYLLYFFAGIVAKRNDWVTKIMSLQTVSSKTATLFLWGLVACLTTGHFVALYSTSPFQSVSDVAEAAKSVDLWNFGIGCFAVIVCLAELQLFYVYFNKGGRVSKFFCESAYGAYIIHYTFVNFGIDIYFRAMRQFSGLPSDLFVFWQAGQQGTTHVVFTDSGGVMVSETYTWFGMLFVCVFANLCSWPAAFFLRKLPLFNQVL